MLHFFRACSKWDGHGLIFDQVDSFVTVFSGSRLTAGRTRLHSVSTPIALRLWTKNTKNRVLCLEQYHSTRDEGACNYNENRNVGANDEVCRHYFNGRVQCRCKYLGEHELE